jgi:hypothetical protein
VDEVKFMLTTRVTFINQGPYRILHLDLSKAKVDDVLMAIDHAKPIIASHKSGSLLILTDVSDARFNTEVGNRLKEFTAHNKPYVRASAVIGVSGLKKVIFDAINRFSGRNLRAFDNKHEAISWLHTQ